jgi:hypothetical protein
VRRDGLLQRAVDAGQHPLAGQLGQQLVDRLLEVDDVVLDQDHRGGGEHRLGHRGDPEDRVAAHRHATVESRRADRLDPDVVAARDERDDPRELATLDACRHRLPHLGGLHVDHPAIRHRQKSEPGEDRLADRGADRFPGGSVVSDPTASVGA